MPAFKTKVAVGTRVVQWDVNELGIKYLVLALISFEVTENG